MVSVVGTRKVMDTLDQEWVGLVPGAVRREGLVLLIEEPVVVLGDRGRLEGGEVGAGDVAREAHQSGTETQAVVEESEAPEGQQAECSSSQRFGGMTLARHRLQWEPTRGRDSGKVA